MLGLNDNAGDYIDSFTALQQADNFRAKPLSGDWVSQKSQFSFGLRTNKVE